jgi:exodeoxyribonuclease VII small subunit
MTDATPITFEDGYRRLQEIAEEVNSTEVPVDRMADLFAEGKGLDKALSDHLAAQKDRIELIERGEGIRAFRIVPPEGAGGVRPEGGDAPPADADFGPASPTGASDDDIPF